LGGDGRLNQSPHLTAIHIMFIREHNRVADELRKLNPNWNDEKLFEEARKICIAEYQKIVYYEWLPLVLGENAMRQAGLIYGDSEESFIDDFEEDVNPGVINEYTTAAFRIFHTLIEGQLERYTEMRDLVNTTRLSDVLNRPMFVENDFDDFTRGMTSQACHAFDASFDDEVTKFLFRGLNTFGIDLAARDIQRGRDHGLATYNEVRKYCGLKRARKWEDFLDLIPRGVSFRFLIKFLIEIIFFRI
jgi:hypothetical protein